mmetsp:Transcript_24884/g.56306  ORF Transcript_24884/g.56306 Transcript_24884/m.56306 type:complete len:211 (-) Transcript_24884:62-694(-)
MFCLSAEILKHAFGREMMSCNVQSLPWRQSFKSCLLPLRNLQVAQESLQPRHIFFLKPECRNSEMDQWPFEWMICRFELLRQLLAGALPAHAGVSTILSPAPALAVAISPPPFCFPLAQLSCCGEAASAWPLCRLPVRRWHGLRCCCFVILFCCHVCNWVGTHLDHFADPSTAVIGCLFGFQQRRQVLNVRGGSNTPHLLQNSSSSLSFR